MDNADQVMLGLLLDLDQDPQVYLEKMNQTPAWQRLILR